MKGSYILLIELPEEQTIAIGSLGVLYFPHGHYAYVGSAMGGVESRLNRHFRGTKKIHWHIDYLLQKASISSAITCETKDKAECTIARALKAQFDSTPGFGSSDCKCPSHLFFANNRSQMKSTLLATLNSLGMQPGLQTLGHCMSKKLRRH